MIGSLKILMLQDVAALWLTVADELMWMFSARAWALTRTFGELIVRQRHPMCQCQGGDQETREIRGTIKFIKGFWEEMSRSLPDRRSGPTGGRLFEAWSN